MLSAWARYPGHVTDREEKIQPFATAKFGAEPHPADCVAATVADGSEQAVSKHLRAMARGATLHVSCILPSTFRRDFMRSLLLQAIPSDRSRDWENFLGETSELTLPRGAEQARPKRLVSSGWAARAVRSRIQPHLSPKCHYGPRSRNGSHVGLATSSVKASRPEGEGTPISTLGFSLRGRDAHSERMLTRA